MLSPQIQEETIRFTQSIIATHSLSGQEEAVARLIAEKMRQLHYDSVEIDEWGNVIGTRKGAHPGPCVLFDAHMDVVPVTNPEDWSSDPFAAEIRDGKIWGRGASDMKGPLAALVIALGHVPTDQFNGALIVSTSVGEEVHEGAALSKVIDRVKPDGVVICEPNGLCLGVGQKGRAGLVIEVTGKPAHSSVPHLGDNAVYKGVEVIRRLREMPLPNDPILGEGVLELIDAISSPYPSQSTVPVSFLMHYDRRLMQGETMESILQDSRAQLAGLSDWSISFKQVDLTAYTGAKIEAPDFHPGWVIDPASPWVRKAEAALRQVGIEPTYTTARFCTNGSYSAGVAGIPTLIFGPSSGMLAHRIDEHIEISELLQGVEGYMALAAQLTQ